MKQRVTCHRNPMPSSIVASLLAIVPAAVLGMAVFARPAQIDSAFFDRKVRPILEKRCLGCHGVGSTLSGLDLRTRESALNGGLKGPAFVPGSAERSLLYKLVSGARAPLMPPAGKLPASEVRILKQWLDGGAPWPAGKIESAAKQVWWSFKPPVRPPVPNLKSPWIKMPVDAFVLAKLKENGLAPNPPASRGVLIRRAYFDLIGLPPSPEEYQSYLSDPSDRWFAKMVEALLASPRYGERWGRHYLDIVRYADSAGFEGDKDRPYNWRYRDYVIRSFNADKPFDLFLKEQLAGDELRPGDIEATIATGFMALGCEDFAQVKSPRERADEIDDLVATTGLAFLGLTVNCARCHDHKYDPVTMRDYYRLAAIFAPTDRKEIDIPTAEERKEVDDHNAAVEKELAPIRAAAAPLREKGAESAKMAGKEKPGDEEILAALPEEERNRLKKLTEQIKQIGARKRGYPKAFAVTDKGREFESWHINVRGDAFHKGDVVQPGFICALPGGTAEIGPESALPKSTGRRTRLAEWIASERNPLTARVWMNRVWRHHFGRGIVATPSNFGLNGELPTHPELLDWLAVEFMKPEFEKRKTKNEIQNRKSKIENQIPWSLKRVHRMIMLSSAYQQSSGIRREAMAKDPLNRFLWRIPVRRLEAEAVRDSVLAVAGTLNTEMYGPPVYPPVDPTLRADTFQGYNWPEGEDSAKTWRRSVYVKVKRSLLFPELEVFDCPEITNHVSARNVTTTPLQALTMLNGPLTRRQAGFFAERLKRECGADFRKIVIKAYEIALCRPPTESETRLSLNFLSRRGDSALPDFAHALLNLSEFVYVP